MQVEMVKSHQDINLVNVSPFLDVQYVVPTESLHPMPIQAIIPVHKIAMTMHADLSQPTVHSENDAVYVKDQEKWRGVRETSRKMARCT